MEPMILGQELADGFAFVIRAAISHDDDFATQVLEQVAKVLHDLLGGVESVGFGGEIEAETPNRRLDANAADHRHLLAMPTIGLEHGRLAFGSPGATHQWIQKQA